MAAPLIDVGDLIEFIDELRLAGYDISTQQYIGAQNLLLALAANGHLPSDPRALHTWLAPVLCSSPREQNNFYRRFDRWIAQHPQFAQAKAAKKELDKEEAISAEAETRGWRSTLLQPKYLLPFLAVLVIIAGLVFLPPLIPRTLTGQVVDAESKQPLTNARVSLGGKTTVSDSSGGFSISYRSKQLPDTLVAEYPEYETATLNIDANSKSPLVLNLQHVAAPPDDTRSSGPGPALPVEPVIVADPQPTATPIPVVAGNTLKWVRYGGAIFPFFVFGMWLLWEKKLSRALLKKLQSASQPHLDRIVVKGAAGQLFLGQSFRRTIQELRRHRQRGARELDAPGTVHRTIQRGGLFSPFYGLRQTLPEYLVLIDRASFQDQQARLEEELIRRLVQENVFVDSYYFQGDPRICRTPAKDARFVTLQEMAALHPDHHLIIFSDGSTFLNPVTGAPESWLEMFSPWAKRAILTPEPASQWGYREWVLAELDFIVLPATKEGLAALTELIDGGANPLLDRSQRARPFPPLLRERPRRWLDNHEPAPEVANQLRDQLKLFLGSKGYFWLSACSIYPILYWDLTLYLGFKLFSDRSEIEDRLLSLVRLPWFRYGTLPDWLRSKLSSELSAEDNLRIRRILEELFLTVLQQPAEGIRLDIASGKGESRLKRWLTSWKFKRFLRQALKEEPPESPLRDYVFLAFMSGRKPHKLTVSVPNSIRRVFFPQGQFALGLRPISALVLAALLSVSMFFLVPTQAEPPDEGAANTLAGQVVVTASGDRTARVWDAATGQTLTTLQGHTDSVLSVAFSPDSKYVVTASADYTARVWEVATGKTLMTLKGHTGSVRSAAFSPDGKYILTVGADRVRVWDAATGTDMFGIGDELAINGATFSPEGDSYVTAGANGEAILWQPRRQTTMALRGHTAAVFTAAFSPDGKYIVTASADHTARVWDATTGQMLKTFEGHTDSVQSAAFSPDGKYIVTASLDKTARLWEAATGITVSVLNGHAMGVSSAAFSPDGKYVVTASADQTARIWEVASGKVVMELLGHTAIVTSAAFRFPASNTGTPESSKIDQQIADLITKFSGEDRLDASDQLIQLYKQNKVAVVKALIDAIQDDSRQGSSRIHFTIARTLASIRPDWEGSAEQLARLRTLQGSKDYQGTLRDWVDRAIRNFNPSQVINCDCANLRGSDENQNSLRCEYVEAQLKANFRYAGTVTGFCDDVAHGPNARPLRSAQQSPTPTPSVTPTPQVSPSFNFGVSPTRARVGQPVIISLNAAPAGTRASFAVNFGDGASASGSPGSVTHSYNKAGTYKVVAVATFTNSIPAITRTATVIVTEAATVPNVIGMSQDSAQKVAIGDLLSIGKITFRETSGSPEGVVISQSPKAGTPVARYTRIDIIVARKARIGLETPPSVIEADTSMSLPDQRVVVVPNVVGMDVDTAVSTLEKFGLKFDYIPRKNTVVAGQRPKPGEKVAPGTTVTLTLKSKSPPKPLDN